MAKFMMYSVYDSKVNFFHPPMFMRNRGEALRSWEIAANDEKGQISRHPEDFTLFEIGEFDDAEGSLTAQKHQSLGLASQYKRQGNSNQPTLFDAKAQ